MRTQYCGLVSTAYLDQIVTLCGWVHRRRDHGGVIFIDLRDREGLVQVVCDPDRADMFQVAESIRSEFVLKITGKVRRRPAGTENVNLVSGEISWHSTSIPPETRLTFSVPAGRMRTLPSSRTTHSDRNVSTSLKAGESGSATHCVMP